MDQILDSHQTQDVVPVYAGFWRRFVAALIDGIVMAIIQTILTFMFVGSLINTNSPGMSSNVITLYLLVFGIQWLYSSLMESSANQATLGKMALGIRVTDEQGNRISFGKATGRYFSKFLSTLFLMIGYLMMLWSDKKQCLHDRIAGTLVVKN